MYHGRGITFLLDDNVAYELRPTLDVIRTVEDSMGSFVALAERLEKGQMTITEMKALLGALLSVFRVEEDEIDRAILKYGALKCMIPVAAFIGAVLSGCDRVQDSIRPITAGK